VNFSWYEIGVQNEWIIKFWQDSYKYSKKDNGNWIVHEQHKMNECFIEYLYWNIIILRPGYIEIL